MSEEGSRSFSSFWHGAVDKMSSKTVKFMPNITKPSERETEQADTGTSNLTPKQKRRAQVRKAQIEHRQRKQNYIKYLEQDVIDLREMIAATETQAVLFNHENEAIKAVLAKYNISISFDTLPAQPVARLEDNVDSLMNDYRASQNDFTTSVSSEQDLQWGDQSLNSSNTSLVSVNFDEFLDAMCLQITPTEATSPNTNSGIYGSNNSDSALLQPSNPASTSHSPSTISPHPATAAPIIQPATLETLAINFILALEHPCRTHFHPPSPSFDPESAPSGHTLMASSLLYATAPESIFSSFSSTPSQSHSHNSTPPPNPSWTTPTPSLTQLQLLSTSLPKDDWELTPVQAWFLLVERVGLESLLAEEGRVLEAVKWRVGKRVACFEFGAVVEEGVFWEVVGGVLSGDGDGDFAGQGEGGPV